MNDTELFELCKKVYELTEWDSDEPDRYWFGLVAGEYQAIRLDSGDYGWCCPLYTSDYLLEKLPNMTYVYIKHTGRAYAQNSTLADFDYIEYADGNYAPLKALLKLVIALHEAGVEL